MMSNSTQTVTASSSKWIAERDGLVRDFFGRWPTLEEARFAVANHQNVPPLKPLDRPCHDCAVMCEFYTPFSAILSLLPPEEIEARSLEWYCHNNPNRACAGNIAFQRVLIGARER